VDTLRDLVGADPWRESLERSRARRRRHRERRTPRPHAPAGGPPSYWLLCWQSLARRPMTLLASAAGLLSVGLLATTSPRDATPSVSAVGVRTAARLRADTSPRAGAPAHALPAAPAGGGCRPSDNAAGYVNPLARASVTARRIDQGVDYAGAGTLDALGPARITYLATVATGWPGAFVEYQLLSGPEAGCYVYYAEGLTPVQGLSVGETIAAGQPIATILPGSSPGIEIGWAANDGTKSYAAATGQWSDAHEADDIPSAAGLYFSSLIGALGGPPGRIEG
jgi:hypothetical protein